MEASELPPFDFQLVKDRATKEPATGAGELWRYEIIAWQRRFVRSDEPIFFACASPRTRCRLSADVLDRTKIIRVATSRVENLTLTHAQPDVDAIHGRGGAKIAIGWHRCCAGRSICPARY
jgi:hypothetical protein